jgi:hypothetical protein
MARRIFATGLEVEKRVQCAKEDTLAFRAVLECSNAPPTHVPARTEEGLIYEEFFVEEYEAVRESCTGHGGNGRIPGVRWGSTRCGR